MASPQQLQFFYKKLAHYALQNVRVNVAKLLIDCIVEQQNKKILAKDESVLVNILELTCLIANKAQSKTSLTINDLIKGAFIIAIEQYHSSQHADIHDYVGKALNVLSASSLQERVLTAIDYDIPTPPHNNNTIINELDGLIIAGNELEKTFNYLASAENLAQSFKNSEQFWTQDKRSHANMLDISLTKVRQYLPLRDRGCTFSPDLSTLHKVANFKSFDQVPSIHEALNLSKAAAVIKKIGDAIEHDVTPRSK